MILRCLFPLVLGLPHAAFAATPVADANGRVTGEVDGTPFEVAVSCAQDGPMVQAVSHTDMSWTADQGAVEPAARALGMGSMLGLTLYIDGTKYEFGIPGGFDGTFPVSYEGEIRSARHGNYTARFTVECPA